MNDILHQVRWAGHRGHENKEINGVYVYSDTEEPTANESKRSWCGLCGKDDIQDGDEVYDGCIGKLPDENIMNACCGHGDSDLAYVQFLSFGDKHGFPEWINQFFRKRIAGKEAIEFMQKQTVKI